MSSAASDQQDLVLLTADYDTEVAMAALPARHNSIGIAPIRHRLFRHPQQDPGCFGKADVFLRAYHAQYRHALVVFDREGCGQEHRSREAIEADVEDRLSRSGWEGRASAVVIDPEVEAWVWSDSPAVSWALGWKDGGLDLRAWLAAQGWIGVGAAKPDRPKEAMEAVSRLSRKPRSASIYGDLGSEVSVNRCTDPAFLKLKAVLRGWFAK